MFAFDKYSAFDDVDPIVETKVVLRESGPRISIQIASDHRGADVLALLDRVVAHVREQLDYDPMDSIW